MMKYRLTNKGKNIKGIIMELKTVEEIVKAIESLTDSLDNTIDLDHAWLSITKAVGYLSSKDSMYKYKRGKHD